MKVKNSKGSIWYGLHMLPGVAEYREPKKDPFRIFLNEDTIRAMDASFAGKPVFVKHVDEVDQNLDTLRAEADGWVVESFFNSADGRHWAKFIVCSEKGEKAISSGYRLSNCYIPKSFGSGGLWNGVSYEKEVTGGEYEHLALVPDPRYEESIVLTPEQFKAYNEAKRIEVERISNTKGENIMALNFFRRQKVENSFDIESTMVQLPRSKREVTLAQVINEMDEHEAEKHKAMAHPEHHVQIGDEKMTVNELVEKHKALQDAHKALNAEHEELKEKMKDGGEYSEDPKDPGNEDKEKDSMENAEMDDMEAKKAAEKLKAHEEGEIEEAKKAKNAADRRYAEVKEKADKLRNAKEKHIRAVKNAEEGSAESYDPFSAIERGKTRYGS
jgi:DNA repair exonuclease SbcCD ATPase subunit